MLKLSSANALNSDKAKIVSSGERLRLTNKQTTISMLVKKSFISLIGYVSSEEKEKMVVTSILIFFQQCFFQKPYCLGSWNQGLVLYGPFPNKPWFSCVQYKSFKKTVGKGENACSKQFLLFPQCFLPIWRTYCHFLNPSPHNDTFWRPWETSLLKTQWEKEKLLVTSNFSYTHSVFY